MTSYHPSETFHLRLRALCVSAGIAPRDLSEEFDVNVRTAAGWTDGRCRPAEPMRELILDRVRALVQ